MNFWLRPWPRHTCFWATVCKTVRATLSESDHCPVLSVCNVGVLLWPNGWTDQDETWHAGRPRHLPHRVRWGPSSPPPKGRSPQFSAHVCCAQTAGWIKMPLGTEVGLGPGDIVLDGDSAHPPPKGYSPLPNFRSMFIVAKRSPISATAELL